MSAIDRILIPTDFSKESEMACLFSKKLAETYEAKVDLLHVIPSVIYVDEQLRSKANLPDPEKELYPKLFNEAELKLNKLMKEMISSENRGRIFVKIDRKPSEVICNHAEEGNYLMILMSAKGKDRSGLFRGSTTEQVIRRSKIPLFITTEELNMDGIKTILVPTDGSLLSMAALPSAVKLANTFGASITMAYVNEVYGLISNHFSSKANKTNNKEIISQLKSRLNEFQSEKFHKFRVSAHQPGSPLKILSEQKGREFSVSVRFEILTGFSAHNEITQYSNKSADLVVMTTHGRNALAHMIMGSTAEKVAMNVKKPLLAIRPDSALFEKSQQEKS